MPGDVGEISAQIDELADTTAGLQELVGRFKILSARPALRVVRPA